MKRRRFFICLVISGFIVLVFNIYHDYKRPSCVEAQTACIPYAPNVAYGRFPQTAGTYQFVNRTGSTAGTCDIEIIDAWPTPPPTGQQFRGSPIVTLTGFELRFNESGGTNDNEWARGRARILNAPPPAFISAGTGIRFRVEVCFHDLNNDDGWRDDWEWAIRYVVGAWPN